MDPNATDSVIQYMRPLLLLLIFIVCVCVPTNFLDHQYFISVLKDSNCVNVMKSDVCLSSSPIDTEDRETGYFVLIHLNNV